MKPFLGAAFALVIVTWIGFGLRDASFRVQVLDDDGVAVSNAVVTTLFNRVGPDGLSATLHERVEATTDKRGICTLSGRTTGYVNCTVAKHGYYSTVVRDVSFVTARFGKLQSRKALYTCRLRKKVNPVPMYAMRFTSLGQGSDLPWLGRACGFDLVKGDWVAPLGQGETADFLLRLDEEQAIIATTNRFGLSRTNEINVRLLTLSFSSPNDGIQVVMEEKRGGSEFKLPRYAPLDGYDAEYVSRTGVTGRKSDMAEDKNYFFRVRTKTNEYGRLVQAYYGKIRGPISYYRSDRIKFAYYLNPTSMDRNMEFDPTQNLFGRLPGIKGTLGP